MTVEPGLLIRAGLLGTVRISQTRKPFTREAQTSLSTEHTLMSVVGAVGVSMALASQGALHMRPC